MSFNLTQGITMCLKEDVMFTSQTAVTEAKLFLAGTDVTITTRTDTKFSRMWEGYVVTDLTNEYVALLADYMLVEPV